MTTVAQQWPWQVTQGYHETNPGEPEGWHHGVDLGAPGGTPITTPVAGTYDPAASGAYVVAEDVPGMGELLFVHVQNALAGQPAGTPIAAQQAVGTVLASNPITGESFAAPDAAGNLPAADYYTDPTSGIQYSETGPHIHIEAHTVQGAQVGSATGIEDPAAFMSGLGAQGATPGSTPPPFTTAPPPLVDPGHWFGPGNSIDPGHWFGPGGATDPSHYLAGNQPQWFGGVAAIVTKVAVGGALFVAGLAALYLGVKQFVPALPGPAQAAAVAAA